MSDGFVVPLEDDAAENYQLLDDSWGEFNSLPC
jgi:hypothetical protein